MMNNLRNFLILACLCIATTVMAEDGIVRILAVGNSFSRDAIEQNLWDLAAADGRKCVVGNMYIPGCPISRHVECARNNEAAYEYCHINVDGKRERINNKRLDEALREEPWDVVTVQQASYDTGNYDSFTQLSELVAYIRARVPYNTKVMFHQTWAYAKDSKHDGFKRYGHDQMTMFSAIVDCSKRAVADFCLQGLIPAGTAVQFARKTKLGDNLTIDGHHLDTTGRYIAACTWYEYIFCRKVKGNSYGPSELNEHQRRIAQKVAHRACKKYRKYKK